MHLNILPKLWLSFCCHQQKTQKWVIFDILMTILLEVNTITIQMTRFFSSTYIFSSTHLSFCISIPWGPPCIMILSVKYTFTCQRTFTSLLTYISFFYIVFANTWYMKCFAPHLIPIWSRYHGLLLMKSWSEVSWG